MSVSIHQRVQQLGRSNNIGVRWGQGVVRPDGSIRPDAYTVDDNGCMVWKFSMNGKQTPQAGQTQPDGSHKNINVRRMLWEKKFPRETPPWRVIPACGNKRCINPDHAEAEQRVDAGAIVALSLEGNTADEIAAITGRSRQRVVRELRARGIKARRQHKLARTSIRKAAQSLPDIERPASIMPRDWAIFQRAKKSSYQDVANEYNISRERVRQIFNRALRDVLIELQSRGRDS